MKVEHEAMQRLSMRSAFMLKDAELLLKGAKASGDVEALALVRQVELALRKLNSHASGKIADAAGEEADVHGG